MNKIALVIGLLALLAGCGYDEATDPVKCMAAVAKAYPDCEVVALPDRRFSFLVRRPDGAVFYVQSMNPSNTDITAAAPMLPARKP